MISTMLGLTGQFSPLILVGQVVLQPLLALGMTHISSALEFSFILSHRKFPNAFTHGWGVYKGKFQRFWVCPRWNASSIIICSELKAIHHPGDFLQIACTACRMTCVLCFFGWATEQEIYLLSPKAAQVASMYFWFKV